MGIRSRPPLRRRDARRPELPARPLGHGHGPARRRTRNHRQPQCRCGTHGLTHRGQRRQPSRTRLQLRPSQATHRWPGSGRQCLSQGRQSFPQRLAVRRARRALHSRWLRCFRRGDARSGKLRKNAARLDPKITGQPGANQRAAHDPRRSTRSIKVTALRP